MLPPVRVRRDEDLRPAGPLGQHTGVVGVTGDDLVTAVHHRTVGAADQRPRGPVVRGQQRQPVPADARPVQRADQAVRGERLAP